MIPNMYNNRERINATKRPGLSKRIIDAKQALQDAEYILIGAGAGLSAAAGMTYEGNRFQDNFADFIERYGVQDMYTATFYPFPSQEEKWAYFSRHILINRFNDAAGPLYGNLRKLTQGKEYFVLTTNVDCQFDLAGFQPERIFATQGDYGKNQCAKKCHDRLYDNEALIKRMFLKQRDCRIPSALVPKCPRCGGDMDVNLRKDFFFVQDADWHKCNERFENFVAALRGKNTVLMEIGVGFNTPGIIRYPFEQITHQEPNATLIRINRDYATPLQENLSKTICFDEETNEIVRQFVD